jgi:cyclic pyranopterin phosphate synthase
MEALIKPQISAASVGAPSALLDTLGRPMQDLRVSITDRCNFRCVYCMPKEIFGPGYQFLKYKNLLTYEEIVRLSRIFATLGIRKLRLTGGEPLVRQHIERLIQGLAAIPDLDICLTTNGSLLEAKAQLLKDAGLRRITVSLDSLNEEVFSSMNDVNFPVSQVLAGIDAAAEAGLRPVKINMVVKRGMNEDSIVPMARFFKDTGHIVRFIEYMDVGNSNGWVLDDVVTASQIVARIDAEMPLEPIAANYRGEVADRWRFKDGGGEIGVISSVTQPFCSTCTRARISSEGKIYTCLFASKGNDLRALLRSGASDQEISDRIVEIWQARTDRYSEIRSSHTEASKLPKVEMSHIGG